MTKVSIYDPFADVFPTLFRSLLSEGADGGQQQPGSQAVPMRVDVSETDNTYTVKADLPGVPKESIHVDIDGNPAMLDLSRDSRGNLTIKANEHADAHAGKDCALTLYFVSTSRGAKWRPFDFNLRNMTVDARGTTILSRDKNVMKFVLNPEMEITIDGFDRNKDLKAKVKLPKASKAKA